MINKIKSLIKNINLLTILDDIPVGIILLDETGQILIANKTFLDTFSFKKESLTGKAIGEILSPQTKASNKNSLPSFSEISSPTEQIFGIKDKNGKVNHIEFVLYDPGVENRKLYAGFVIGSQMADDLMNKLDKQIEIKDSIQDELEEERELSEMKSRFLSIASHEFRTPLAGILSSLNLITRYLEAEQDNWFQFKNREKVSNHLGKIKESVKNLTTILDNFLTLGNIEKGEIPLRMSRFDIVRTLNLQSTQFQELCKPGQKINYEHTGKKSSVYLDKNLLRNIMNNLFSNAIRFSNENSEIKLYSMVSTDEVRIIMSDEGIGIPKADQNNIFRRFYRAKNSLALQDGTGLGLSIVKRYVEMMEGDISFESEENKGTTFYITFPNKNR